MDTPAPTPTPAPQPQPTPAPSGNGAKILLIIVIILLVLGILGACGAVLTGFVISKGIKKAMENAGVEIEGDGNGGRISFTGQDGKRIEISGKDDSGSITVTDQDGQVATFEGGSNTLPPGFPTSFPTPAQFTIKGSATQTSPEGAVYVVTWEGTGTPTDIAAWYNTALPNAGWRVNGTTTTTEGASVIFEKETTTEARDNGLITIGTSNGKTEVALWLLDAK